MSQWEQFQEKLKWTIDLAIWRNVVLCIVCHNAPCYITVMSVTEQTEHCHDMVSI